MRKFQKLISDLWRSSGANVAITFAVALPALLACIGLAVDYAQITKKQSQLQSVADAAAVAAANELPLANSKADIVQAAAKAFIVANMPSAGAAAKGGGSVASDVQVVDKFTGVEVTIKENWQPFFAHFLTDQATPIVAYAKANVIGEGLICVVGLMPRSDRAGIHMDDNAIIDAPNCGIYSNSSNPYAIRLDKNSKIEARTICSVGGFGSFGGGTSISPAPLTDCPAIDDPLSMRAAPIVGACDYNGLEIGKSVTTVPVSKGDVQLSGRYRRWFSRYSKSTPVPPPSNYVAVAKFSKAVLVPGVYCGGLFIGENQDVTFMPGEYIIKDGPFIVSGNARVKGEGVGFYLTGKDSIFDFQPDTTIDLVAPTKGTLAGLLFFEDRNVPHGTTFNPFFLSLLPDDIRLHRIRSNNARQLLGTIYLPHAILMIDSKAPVADKSAYTAIIAWRVWLREGPDLKLNADYKSTDVPVPSSLIGGKIVLSQ